MQGLSFVNAQRAHGELFMNGESEQSGALSENIKWCAHAERTEKWESGTFRGL